MSVRVLIIFTLFLSSSCAQEEHGFYTRQVARFTVVETGEPLVFDYVVGCGVGMKAWQSDGYTGGSHVPQTLIQPSGTGGAVLLRTFEVCKSAGYLTPREFTDPRRKDSRIGRHMYLPDDPLPVPIWFEDADDLSFGWGYTTEQAYDSPQAELKFHGMTIERATRGDFLAWKKLAAEEYEQVGVIPGPWGWNYSFEPAERLNRMKYAMADGLPEGWLDTDTGRSVAQACAAMVRVPVPADVIAQFEEVAPEGSEGYRYWVPDPTGGIDTARFGEIIRSAGAVFGPAHDGNSYEFDQYERSGIHGTINKAGSGYAPISFGDKKVMPTQVPLLPRSQSNPRPFQIQEDGYPLRIPVGDEWHGFSACGGHEPIDKWGRWGFSSSGRKSRSRSDFLYVDPDWRGKPMDLFIGGELVYVDDPEYTRTSANVNLIVDRQGFVYTSRRWG